MSAVLGTYARANVEFDRGEGAYLWTPAGDRYLDFAGGVAVNVLGHAHPHLVEALNAQAQKLWHSSNLYRITGQERLAQRLTEVTFADKVFFANSGAEAMEASVKVARKYHSHHGQPERFRIITFEGAFHGRTLAMLAAGNQPKHLAGFGPKVDGFDQVPLGDLAAARNAITEETAGILIEPVQGEGGVRPAGWEFLRALRELTQEHGILLLLDEVQTGMGRTGKLFAYEWSGIEPDVMGIAKGLGGGFPIGACLATEEAAAGMTPGSHGSTFGGNPLAAAAANATLDIVLKPDFLPHVQRMGLLFKQRLAEIADRHPSIVSEIRGEGLLLGLVCKIPNTEVSGTLFAERLLTVAAGDNVVRLLPPLIVTENEIGEACATMDSAFARLNATHPK
ncbi:MAG: aspartate aminotransferase family protein [Rhodomicrobium sp.]